MITDQVVVYDAGTKVFVSGLFAIKQPKAVYVKDYDCYFIAATEGNLYKKSADASSPILWIEEKFRGTHHNPLVYSEKQKRLFTTLGANKIAVIDPRKEGEIEFQVELPSGSTVMNIKFFEQDREEFALILTYDRYLYLFKYHTEAKEGKIITRAHYPAYKNDWAAGIDIDPSGKVIMVTHYYWVTEKPSKFSLVLVFELWGNRLTQMAQLIQEDGTYWMQALEFAGYYGGEATFIGIDRAHGGDFQLFRYNIYTNEIKSDRQKRVRHHKEGHPQKTGSIVNMAKHHDWLYYTGDGKLMRARVKK